MIRLFFNPLDAKSLVEYPIAEGTQLINFLQTHYPTGFDGALRVFVGADELDLADLDYEVKAEDQITMLVMPSEGVTWVAVGKILISAVVGAAIGYVINLIFAPKTPSFGDEGAESVVYSLNPTRNEVRLGQPIASHYGTVSHPPPFASAPSVFFWEGSNDMYVDELLCLGQGKFETITTDDIFIGDTPLSAIEVGTVKYWVFDSDFHQQQMGRVGDWITDAVANTETPWAFYEDVFTSPEVEDFQFEEAQNDGYSDDLNEVPIPPAPISGSAYAAGFDPVTGMYLLGRIEGVDDTLKISGGDTVILTGTTSNNITFVVGSVAPDPVVAGKMTLFQQWATTDTQLVDEIPLNAAAQYQINQVVDGMTGGPFRAQKIGSETNRIDCDIVFPQGLFRVDGDSGKIKTNSVPLQLEFTYQAVDQETGAAIGLPVQQTREWTSKLRIPIRVTVSSGELPPAHYECSVRRVNPVSDDSRETDLVTWVGLKGFVTFDRNATAYGDVSLIAFRMKATNGIAQAARSRIRVVTTRVLDSGESDNPITVIKDIWNNQAYGLGFPLGQLDPAMDTLETLWGDPLGPKFNGSYDQKSTGFDAMQSAASLAGAKVVNNGQLTNVVADAVQPVRKALFTTANIVRDSLEIIYTFDALGDFTGNKVEYRNPLTFDAEYVYAPEETANPESFTLFGCSDQDYAQEMANYLWNVKTDRRKLVRFDTELEGLIPSFGQRIGVSHTMPDWGQSGVFVQMIDALTWRVDQALDWTENNVIVIRDDQGLPSSPYTVVQGTHPQIVVFSEVPVISDQQGREPTSYAFGVAETVISDFIVTKISPKGDNIVTVEGQVYNESVYKDAPWQMNPEQVPCKYYECDAIETAFADGAVAGLVAMWDMLVVTGPDTGLQVNRVASTTGADLTCTGALQTAINGIDPCDTTDCVRGTATAGNGPSNWENTNALLWDAEFQAYWSCGGWVRAHTNDTVLPFASVNDFVIFYITTSTGKMQCNFRNQGGTEIEIDFGLVFPLDNDWHQVTYGFDGRTNPTTAFVEVDGSRVTGNYAGTLTATAPFNKLSILSSDRLGDATAGLDSVYMWVAEGLASSQALSTLSDAYAQNQSSYVDPNPNCVNAPCKYYECDAYKTALSTSVTRLWLLEDDPIPASIFDIKANEELVGVNGGGTLGATILEGVCVGTGGAIGVASYGFVSDGTPISYSTSRRGGFGAFFRPTSPNGINAMFAEFGAANSPAITLTPSGGGMTVQWHPAATGVSYTYPTGYDGKYVWLNFYVTDSTGSEVEIEVFYDWVSQGKQTLIWAIDLSLPTELQGFHIGNGGGTGATDLQYGAYLDGNITSGQANILAAALAQNDSNYVDPNENCVP